MSFANVLKNIPNPTSTNSSSNSKQRNQHSDEESERTSQASLKIRRKMIESFENEKSRKNKQLSSPKLTHGYNSMQKKMTLPFPPIKAAATLAKNPVKKFGLHLVADFTTDFLKKLGKVLWKNVDDSVSRL